MIFYRSIEPVKAISFDLDDTLYDNHPLMRQAEGRLIAYMAAQYEACQGLDMHYWRKHKRDAIAQNPALKSDMGELRRVGLTLGFTELGFSGSTLKEAVTNCFEYFYFERSNFEIDKNIYSLLLRLADKVPLVAITNGNVNLEQVGLDKVFRHTWFAKVDSPMKPHRHMFDAAAQTLGVSAGNILHVGDNLEKDIMGARRSGMASAWFACNRPMNLVNDPTRTTILPDVQLDALEELEQLI